MSPKLIICAGPPCSGKSTVALALANKFNCRLLQMDCILSVLMPHSDWSEADRLLGYRSMLLMAGELICCARSVVLDATFTSEACRELLRSFTHELQAETHVFEIRVSPEVASRRFQTRRGHAAVDLTEKRVRELAENYPYSAAGLVLNGESPVEEIVQRVARFFVSRDPSEFKYAP